MLRVTSLTPLFAFSWWMILNHGEADLLDPPSTYGILCCRGSRGRIGGTPGSPRTQARRDLAGHRSPQV